MGLAYKTLNVLTTENYKGNQGAYYSIPNEAYCIHVSIAIRRVSVAGDILSLMQLYKYKLNITTCTKH